FWSVLSASTRAAWAHALILELMLVSGFSSRCFAQSSSSSTRGSSLDSAIIANLAQLTDALCAEERLCREVRLEGVVLAASRQGKGMVVLQDDTGVELLELGRREEPIAVGDRVHIEGNNLLLRRRERGTQISAVPVVDNDGLHG